MPLNVILDFIELVIFRKGTPGMRLYFGMMIFFEKETPSEAIDWIFENKNRKESPVSRFGETAQLPKYNQ